MAPSTKWKIYSAMLTLYINLISVTKSHLSWHFVHGGNSGYTNWGRENEIAYDNVEVPSPRRDMGLGYEATRNVLVMFGGRTKKRSTLEESFIALNDTWIYDISTNSWREAKSDCAPPARHSFIYGVSGGYFYIATGEGDAYKLYSDIWRFKFETESWERLYVKRSSNEILTGARLPKIKGGAGGICCNSSSLFISMGIGSSGRKISSYTFIYDTKDMGLFKVFSDNSLYTPNFHPRGRYGVASAMLSSNDLLIFGGCLSGGGQGGACPSHDSWIYSRKTNEWISLQSPASARTYASLAMLPTQYGESRAVLYGGIEEGGQILSNHRSRNNELAIFNPKTFKWSIVQTEGIAPTKRASVSMATGKDGIFMFGGISEDSSLNNELYLLLGNSFLADNARQVPSPHSFFNLITVHGVLNVISWGFFIQWGAFFARYMKRKHPLWYQLHRIFQIIGLIIGLAGFVIGAASVRQDHFKFLHGIIGLVVTVLGLSQSLSALLKPKPPTYRGEPPSMKRQIWGFFHKTIGRSVLILALANISLGLFLALAPQVMWSAWFTYVIFLLLSYFAAETLRSCTKNNCGKVRKRKDNLNNNILTNLKKNPLSVTTSKEALVGATPPTKCPNDLVEPSASSTSLFEEDYNVNQLHGSSKSTRSYGKAVEENEALVH